MKHTSPFPRETDRTLLRPHQESDAAPLQRIYSQTEVARYLLDDPWSEMEAEQRVQQRLSQTGLDQDNGALALVIEHDGTVIGDVLLWLTNPEHRVAEIGWVMDPAYGGQGLATEAVSTVLDIGLEHYALHRVAAQMDARNTASSRLAERIGMRHEAHLRQDWWSKGEWTDTLIYGVLASDR
ncbi:GNAT family N-acetyltransferase [Nesterenkonia sphaerica]|uniref:GNAT family N-acetyltransferase n=1 Tax=Nesterenkonia sphaerica TaxID=1804988 RepID=A0A5R8ZWB3_9MICC|nr:GNAT family protein [Nesterenkonia sphaerica]TLP70691.1 GNAT family N-acetyltransferase [Nesterenkonia sphaerica]